VLEGVQVVSGNGKAVFSEGGVGSKRFGARGGVRVSEEVTR
jgi:hypothetical protein